MPSSISNPPTAPNPWSTSPSKSSLVSIGTHRLFLSVSGPPRTPTSPIVIIFPGADDTVSSWPAVARLLAPTTRILQYDRSGLGLSDARPTTTITTISTPNPVGAAELAAQELSTLLSTAAIAPPFILLAHSYGCVVAREFLHLQHLQHPPSASTASAAIAGLVLVDASTERQSTYFQYPDPAITAVLGSLNFATVTGLRAETVLTRSEWRVRAIQASRVPAADETRTFLEICATLAAKRQVPRRVMGPRWPVSVVRGGGARDYARIFAAGVAAGNGTVEQRRAFGALLETWDGVDEMLQREQLGLSGRSRYRKVEDCGHNVHLVRPDVVAEEVAWVLRNGGDGSGDGGREKL